MRQSRSVAVVAVLLGLALLVAGCLQSGGGGESGGGGNGGADALGAGGSDPGDGVVQVFGTFTAEEAQAFNASVKPFEEKTGIDVRYTGNSDFTTLIRSRVSGGSPPDIALFPQPGLLLELAADGETIVPIGKFLDVASLKQTLIPGFLSAVTTEDGTIYGSPIKMTVKSLVWVPKAYSEQGYSLKPSSMAELKQIAQEIKASGTAPWCIGFESGASTGWVGTDWIEDFVLRIGGPELYDKWYKHKIPFTHPVVKKAFEAFGDIIFPNGNVLGGTQGILATPFGEAGNPAFQDPPGCYLHKQADFITGFFPPEVQKNLDQRTDVMVLPPVEDGWDGLPILGGGDMAALFNGGDEDSIKVMQYITSDEFGAAWAQAGGWLSPHKTFDTSNYPNETTKKIAELVASADAFRFDASDLMPPEVGAGTFWQGMVQWVSGQKSTDEVLQMIENSWPTQQ